MQMNTARDPMGMSTLSLAAVRPRHPSRRALRAVVYTYIYTVFSCQKSNIYMQAIAAIKYAISAVAEEIFQREMMMREWVPHTAAFSL